MLLVVSTVRPGSIDLMMKLAATTKVAPCPAGAGLGKDARINIAAANALTAGAAHRMSLLTLVEANPTAALMVPSPLCESSVVSTAGDPRRRTAVRRVEDMHSVAPCQAVSGIRT